MADTHVTLSDATWRFEAMYDAHGRISTLWVSCVHWRGCDDHSDHGPHGEFGLGVSRSGGDFLVGNKWFWDAHRIDYRPVLDAVARVMATGDLADAALTDPNAPNEDELH